MSHRIEIHSRWGNVALAVVGVVYLVGAVATLLYYLVTSWDASALTDRVLQLTLAASALAGAFLLLTAADNLGVHFRQRRRHS
jgi:NADH:ubiquinone oxidoreductase subunit 6 (subunit J)